MPVHGTLPNEALTHLGLLGVVPDTLWPYLLTVVLWALVGLSVCLGWRKKFRAAVEDVRSFSDSLADRVLRNRPSRPTAVVAELETAQKVFCANLLTLEGAKWRLNSASAYFPTSLAHRAVASAEARQSAYTFRWGAVGLAISALFGVSALQYGEPSGAGFIFGGIFGALLLLTGLIVSELLVRMALKAERDAVMCLAKLSSELDEGMPLYGEGPALGRAASQVASSAAEIRPLLDSMNQVALQLAVVVTNLSAEGRQTVETLSKSTADASTALRDSIRQSTQLIAEAFDAGAQKLAEHLASSAREGSSAYTSASNNALKQWRGVLGGDGVGNNGAFGVVAEFQRAVEDLGRHLGVVCELIAELQTAPQPDRPSLLERLGLGKRSTGSPKPHSTHRAIDEADT